MFFIIIVVGIFLLSFLFALRSLRALTKTEEIGTVKNELRKGKVLFKSNTSKTKQDSQDS